MSTLTRKTVARKSVPVTEEDAQTVQRVRQSQSVERAALAEMGITLSANPSEAEALQALVEAGRTAIQQQVMVSGYAALAASKNDEDREYEQAMRQRRRSSED